MKISGLKRMIILALWLNLPAAFAQGQDKWVTININLTKTHQTIDNFGASDAWSCQFIGSWPDEKRNKIADLLFSADTLADGSPKGIALSLWRFNIGAGSTEQGQQSGIKDEWRRAESFLNTDGTYNWQKQAGQVWFLKAAKARGVTRFLGFNNSPPVQFTLNGKSYTSKGLTNIAPSQYDAFANYLSAVTKGVEQVSKVKFDYISPVNEPQWEWSDGGQEGCPYTNTEISGLVKSINQSFIKNRINIKILVAEAGSIKYLLDPGNKGNQVQDFFDQTSANYIGNLKNFSKNIAAHSYFTTSPLTTAVDLRKKIAERIATIPGLSYWQSEYCILGDNGGEIDGRKRDLGINAALYVAAVIHTDLTVANATAWQWWTAISAYDYKDGLIYVDKNKTDGNYYASKMLWALGNYSRFIRPGAKRVDAEVTTSMVLSKPLLVSAYRQGKNLITVVINQNDSEVPVKLNTNSGKINNVKTYNTSATNDLKVGKLTGVDNQISIPARSITTLTAIIK